MKPVRWTPLLAAVACLGLLAPACEHEFHPSPTARTRRPRAGTRTRTQTPTRPSPDSRATRADTVDPPGTTLLRATFLEIGQGDATLLESSDGHAALIDTGPPEAREALMATLARRGIRQLDWLMLSHPHLDHLANADDVIRGVQVRRVIDAAFPHPIVTYDRLLALIQERTIPYLAARSGNTLELGAHVRVEILAPREPFIERSRSDANANSIVARVTAGDRRVLFTGDAESETEERLLAERAAMLSADVLKVAHHGSRYASSEHFLQAVAPRHAVISCARDNEYGHPHRETLQALMARSIAFYRTDLQGDVTLTTDGTDLTLTPAREAYRTAMERAGVRPRRTRSRAAE